MKKTIYFAVLLLIIIVASVIYTAVTGKPSKNSRNENPVAEPENNQTQSDKIDINTGKGIVAVNNIQKNPVEKIAFDGSVVFAKSDNYAMSYYPPDQGFIVTIENPNLDLARSQAEDEFIKLLGVDKEQACLLKVTLNVPFGVSEKAAGQNYGLSFCPNGKPFPQN
ncbi:MAG: hypothetical protein WC831_04130 [Parcubacteria group bacterium]|jgi:hypothetical protein